MKLIAVTVWWVLPLTLLAQEKAETPFRHFENWQSVLNEAKAKKKRIFIDAFTTWCVPCKKMDISVYTHPRIKEFLDDNFISVKVQMDKTSNDPVEIKNWYSEAAMLSKRFHINAYPTFVFLDSGGQLLQISKGYQGVPAFLTTLRAANDPKQAYATKVEEYKTGKLSTKDLLELALKAKEYKEDSLAMEVATVYKRNYFDKQKLSDLINPKLVSFLSNFYQLFSVDEPVIKYWYEHPAILDSLFKGTGSAVSFVDYYIGRDLVQPMIVKHEESGSRTSPNWQTIQKMIAKKYDPQTAKRIISNQRLAYYNKKQDWPNVAKYEIKRIESNGLDTAGLWAKVGINNLVWDVFVLHIDDPKYLKKAIKYMETILPADTSQDAWIDTYANLLYKTGRKEDALQYQQKALIMATTRNDKSLIETYKGNLNKMNADLPTWIPNQN